MARLVEIIARVFANNPDHEPWEIWVNQANEVISALAAAGLRTEDLEAVLRGEAEIVRTRSMTAPIEIGGQRRESAADLAGLIGQLKAATEPNWALFFYAAKVLGQLPTNEHDPDMPFWEAQYRRFINAEAWESAAISLVREMLPEHWFELLIQAPLCRAEAHKGMLVEWWMASHVNPAIALLLAALRARQAQEGSESHTPPVG